MTILTAAELQAMRDWFRGPGTEQFQTGEVIAALFDHIDALQQRRSGQEWRPNALTTTYVQTVPDKCDRIVWRGHYYALPPAPAEEKAEK